MLIKSHKIKSILNKFKASLMISAGIGMFYAFKDRNNKSVDKYYYGSRKMSPVFCFFVFLTYNVSYLYLKVLVDHV